MMVTIEDSGMGRLRQLFQRMSRKSVQTAPEVVEQLAETLVKKVQENASGRPGPEVVTGVYRSSIRVMQPTSTDGNSATAIVGTDAPQAMRLEYGYFGTDALGRQYSQPPYWHWRPALVEMEPELRKASSMFINEIEEA